VTVPEPLPQQFLLINPYYAEAVKKEKIAESREAARRINRIIAGRGRVAFLESFEDLSPESKEWLRKAVLAHPVSYEKLLVLLNEAAIADSLMGNEKFR
jgi:hypothetical protein